MLYLVACFFMILDHLAIAFFPDCVFLRFLGRSAFPLFAFGVGLGSQKTHDPFLYLSRLFFLACISQIPFSVFNHSLSLNVLFALFLGLALYLSLYLHKYFLAITILILSFFADIEYGLAGVVFVFSCCVSVAFQIPLHFLFYLFVSFRIDPWYFSFIPGFIALAVFWFFDFRYRFRIPFLLKYSFYPLQFCILSLVRSAVF